MPQPLNEVKRGDLVKAILNRLERLLDNSAGPERIVYLQSYNDLSAQMRKLAGIPEPNWREANQQINEPKTNHKRTSR